MLQVLAAHQGKLVSKDELVAAVWRGVAVTDDSLVQCIAEIRKALGDDRHTVVKTVLKRGYMLAVEPGAQQFWRKRSTLAAAGVLASIIAAGSLLLSSPGSARKPPSLAILPFEKILAARPVGAASPTASPRTSSRTWPAQRRSPSSRRPGRCPRVSARKICVRSPRIYR